MVNQQQWEYYGDLMIDLGASSVCEGLKGPGGEKRRQALAAKACATYRASCDVAFWEQSTRLDSKYHRSSVTSQ